MQQRIVRRKDREASARNDLNFIAQMMDEISLRRKSILIDY